MEPRNVVKVVMSLLRTYRVYPKIELSAVIYSFSGTTDLKEWVKPD